MVSKKPTPAPKHKDLDADLHHLIRDVHRLQCEMIDVARAILTKLDTLAVQSSAMHDLTNKLNQKSAALAAAIKGAS